MRFRPCIDLHQGRVKQIVGETLTQDNLNVVENFVSELDSAYYAKMYQKDQLQGGHIIMLGGGNEAAAVQALLAYPGGMQIGGGIMADNAVSYLEKGASHVIVTSYVFRNGELNMPNLQAILAEVGKENLVIDLSCKERDGKWFVVTNHWTTFSDFEVNAANIRELEQYCSEFLIHAVDVEGKQSGIQQTLASQLAQWVNIPTTYAGGARSIADLDIFKSLTNSSIDITIGSALDIFGGSLPYKQVVEYCNK
ncbi:MAG: phosphoribosylformimino-5-aminoimidazole carboxamide ribotide isomerase [Paenibacillaceae bacterium]